MAAQDAHGARDQHDEPGARVGYEPGARRWHESAEQGPGAQEHGRGDDGGVPGGVREPGRADAPRDVRAVVSTEAPGDGREASVETIQHELTAVARRARATAARMHPELSLVSYTILAHLEDHQDSRATDLAAYYLLDKSTVSRQLAALERLGLIERRVDEADHRVQVLRLAPRGQDLLAAARVRRRAAFHERLAQWDPADLARFADYLVRYNADATTHP